MPGKKEHEQSVEDEDEQRRTSSNGRGPACWISGGSLYWLWSRDGRRCCLKERAEKGDEGGFRGTLTACCSRLVAPDRRGRFPNLGGWVVNVGTARSEERERERERGALHEGATGECAGVFPSHHVSTLGPPLSLYIFFFYLSLSASFLGAQSPLCSRQGFFPTRKPKRQGARTW
jgi:hypothetical protein